MKNIETRKVIALFSTVLLGGCLAYSIATKQSDITMMLIPVFSGAITWYFAKSTALEQPKGGE